MQMLAAVTSIALLVGLAGLGAPATAQPVAGASAPYQLRVPVLYYHHVKCLPPGSTTPYIYICPAQFDRQLADLHAHGWQTITADELAEHFRERRCPENKRFVVSIDDGWVDGWETAAPILEAWGMRGSFYVNPGVPTPDRLTFDQLRDLVARGHAVGNHTLSHLNLDTLGAGELYEQVEGAQQLLAAELGYRPPTFAYPEGRTSDAAVAQLERSGLTLAFTTVIGARESTTAPLLSPRLPAGPTDSGARILRRLEPYTDACRQPTADLAIGLTAAGPFATDNVYSPEPIDAQTARRTEVRRSTRYRFWIQVQNDGQQAAAFDVAATATGARHVTVRLWVNGANVTDAVLSGTYTTPLLGPGASVMIELPDAAPAIAQRAADARDSVHASPVGTTAPDDVVRAVASR